MFSKTFLLDLAERSIWTFLQVTGGLLFADGTGAVPMEMPFSEKLKIAAIAGAIAVFKGIMASRVGNSNTAQAMPGVESAYVNVNQ